MKRIYVIIWNKRKKMQIKQKGHRPKASSTKPKLRKTELGSPIPMLIKTWKPKWFSNRENLARVFTILNRPLYQHICNPNPQETRIKNPQREQNIVKHKPSDRFKILMGSSVIRMMEQKWTQQIKAIQTTQNRRARLKKNHKWKEKLKQGNNRTA